MEPSAAQKQRRVRMAQAQLEMQVLAELPRSANSMQRYTALKRRRYARMIQLWYRRRQGQRQLNATSASGGLPSDVSGAGTARCDQSLADPASALNASHLSTMSVSQQQQQQQQPGSFPACSPAAAASYDAAVLAPRLEAVERRVLSRAAGIERGDLDELRDRSDALVAEHARRAARKGTPEARHYSLAAGSRALLATAAHLAAPPPPSQVLQQALQGPTAQHLPVWEAATWQAEPAPAPEGPQQPAAENLPPLHTLPAPYRQALTGGALAWPPACQPATRAAAAAAHAAALTGVLPGKPWWHTASPQCSDVREFAHGWPAGGGKEGRDLREGRPGWASLVQQAYLPPPVAAPRQPVSVPGALQPLCLGSGEALQHVQRLLDAPPPPAAPLFPTSTRHAQPSRRQRATPPTWDCKEASNAWLRLVCSPMSFSASSSSSSSSSSSTGTPTPTPTPLAFDGTLETAAHVLGVADPWATSAALIDPTAVTAAVRAAAAAEAQVQQLLQGDEGAAVDLEAILRASSSSSSSSPAPAAVGHTQPLEDLVNLSAELYAFAPLNLRAEGLSEALGVPLSSGAGGSPLPLACLAPPQHSIEARVQGVFEVLRRQVVCADALLCLEGEDERGRVEGGGAGSAGSGAGKAGKLGRPPMASLAALTREVRARCIQRAWRRVLAVRRARGVMEARRQRLGLGGGKAGRVRSAVLNLVRALEASGVSLGGEEEGGEGGGGGAVPHVTRALLALAGAGAADATRTTPAAAAAAAKARPPLGPPLTSTGPPRSTAATSAAVAAAAAAPAPAAASTASSTASLRRSTFLRYTERAAAAVEEATPRPALLSTRHLAATQATATALDSSLGLIMPPISIVSSEQ